MHTTRGFSLHEPGSYWYEARALIQFAQGEVRRLALRFGASPGQWLSVVGSSSFSYVMHHGFARYSALFVPKLFPNFWGEPLR
jgi:hypothetical protein